MVNLFYNQQEKDTETFDISLLKSEETGKMALSFFIQKIINAQTSIPKQNTGLGIKSVSSILTFLCSISPFFTEKTLLPNVLKRRLNHVLHVKIKKLQLFLLNL